MSTRRDSPPAATAEPGPGPSAPTPLAKATSGRPATTTPSYNALRSMRETLGRVEVAEALGYIDGIDDEVLDRIRKILGTLVVLVR